MASTPTCLQHQLEPTHNSVSIGGRKCAATHVVSISLVNSSMSSGLAYIQNSLKLRSVMQYCGFSRQALKNSTEDVASQRCRELVKLWPSSQQSLGAGTTQPLIARLICETWCEYVPSSDFKTKTRHITAKAIIMVLLVLSSMIQLCKMERNKLACEMKSRR